MLLKNDWQLWVKSTLLIIKIKKITIVLYLYPFFKSVRSLKAPSQSSLDFQVGFLSNYNHNK